MLRIVRTSPPYIHGLAQTGANILSWTNHISNTKICSIPYRQDQRKILFCKGQVWNAHEIQYRDYLLILHQGMLLENVPHLKRHCNGSKVNCTRSEQKCRNQPGNWPNYTKIQTNRVVQCANSHVQQRRTWWKMRTRHRQRGYGPYSKEIEEYDVGYQERKPPGDCEGDTHRSASKSLRNQVRIEFSDIHLLKEVLACSIREVQWFTLLIIVMNWLTMAKCIVDARKQRVV